MKTSRVIKLPIEGDDLRIVRGRSPLIAGAAMALSSVSVVANTLLLKRWKPEIPNG